MNREQRQLSLHLAKSCCSLQTRASYSRTVTQSWYSLCHGAAAAVSSGDLGSCQELHVKPIKLVTGGIKKHRVKLEELMARSKVCQAANGLLFHENIEV